MARPTIRDPDDDAPPPAQPGGSGLAPADGAPMGAP